MDDIFEHVWQGVGVVAVLIAMTIGTQVLTVEKKIDGYYLSQGSGRTTATCVYSHWTWHIDESAFCTNNSSEALEVLERANATLRK